MARSARAVFQDLTSPFDARQALLRHGLSLAGDVLFLGSGIALLAGLASPLALAAAGAGFLMVSASEILALRDGARI